MPDANEEANVIAETLRRPYPFGFITPIQTDVGPLGLSEQTVRFIAERRGEPDWLLDWRLAAYRRWQTMTEPTWANVAYSPINYQTARYWAAPKRTRALGSIEELDPALRDTFNKLGISLGEQERLGGVAVDAVVDSVSVATTFQKMLSERGILFCSFGEAVKRYPELVRKHLGTVIPADDNFFAALNAAVMSDGTFVYVPKGVKCPVELSSYFRMNTANTGQFERTLIIVDEGAEVSYLEGCTAPRRDEQPLHAAVVEIVAEADAVVRYATVQNWYPGDEQGRGGVLNFVTKRGLAMDRAKISWTQVETGAAITWKYPSVVLKGDRSEGAFYSVAVTANRQQADTGTKMIHLGRNTTSTVIAKSIAAGASRSTYRGLLKVGGRAAGAKSYAQCDSLLIGPGAAAYTLPHLENRRPDARLEHEATTSRIGEDQLFYLAQRGLRQEDAIGMVVNGYCRAVTEHLPMEFAVEAKRLLALTLANSIG